MRTLEAKISLSLISSYNVAMIDTHTHLNFEAYNDDWQEVVERALLGGVTKMIVVGTDVESSKRAVEMAESHDALYATVGIHPHHAKSLMGFDKEDRIKRSDKKVDNYDKRMHDDITTIASLVSNPKVVAIGEIGLDYHRYSSSSLYKTEISEDDWQSLNEVQRDLFERQLKIAANFGKPVILHSREAKSEVLKIIQSLELRHNITVRGVFHCFDGSLSYLKEILDADFYVSMTGNITFVPDRSTVALSIPLNRLLLETDCPYMTPKPYRGKRNQPDYILEIAKHHAKSRNVSLEHVNRHTSLNAQTLFSLKN